jgi:hypothetical protein
VRAESWLVIVRKAVLNRSAYELLEHGYQPRSPHTGWPSHGYASQQAASSPVLDHQLRASGAPSCA